MSELTWGYMMAGYLFLGGLAGGAYVVSALADLFKGDDYEVLSKSGCLVTLFSVVIGIVLLFLDLKRFEVAPLGILNAYRRFPASMVSVGTWVLTGLAIVSLVTCVLWYLGGNWLVRKIVGVVGIVLGLSTAAYTGILLSYARGVPFWSSPFLPWTFVISGTLTGLTMALLMIPVAAIFMPKAFQSFMILYERKGQFTEMLTHTQKYVTILIITELALVVLELATGHGAVDLLLTGTLSWTFYAYLLLGLLIPLGISYYISKLRTSGKDGYVVLFSTSSYVLILVGGFLLRYVILTAGQIFH